MASTEEFPIDLGLLGSFFVLRSTPSWEQVQNARQRLEVLRVTEQPYVEMEPDRDVVLQYALILQRSAQTIACAVCLTSHLARYSLFNTVSGKFTDGLRVLSTGLELRSLDETGTQGELLHCMRTLFAPSPPPPIPPLPPNPAQPDQEQWRISLEKALESVRSLPPPDSQKVQQAAWSVWQDRLLAFAGGRPDVLPDIDYLCCLAEGSLPGTTMRARLRSLLVREWSEAYIAAAAAESPSPLWFVFGVLGGLGFDLPKELGATPVISGAALAETTAAQQFLNRVEPSVPKKGLIAVCLKVNSLTSQWRTATAMPTLTVTPEEYLGTARLDLRAYFQSRLHGILIEVDPAEKVEDALKRVKVNEIQASLTNVRLGLLLAQTPQSSSAVPSGYVYTVNPKDPMEASLTFRPSGTV